MDSYRLECSFVGLIPSSFMATITKENQFSLTQLNPDTLLLFIDEWQENFLVEDALKRLLQGRLFLHFFCIAVLHQRDVVG